MEILPSQWCSPSFASIHTSALTARDRKNVQLTTETNHTHHTTWVDFFIDLILTHYREFRWISCFANIDATGYFETFQVSEARLVSRQSPRKNREHGHVYWHVHDSRQLTSVVDFAKQKVPQREVWSLTRCTKNSEGILMISYDIMSCWFSSKQVDRTLTSSQFQMSISRSGKKHGEEWQNNQF